MLRLRLKAPFAAFRSFTAGSFRPSAPFLTPSAAYGLLMNLAGIETRLDDGKSSMTLTRSDLPAVELALGAVSLPESHTIYQQLHNYPVGESGAERKESCKGNKYNIQPIRREFLSGLDARLEVRADADLLGSIRLALNGLQPKRPFRRYGLPFLGDNNFLVDILREEPLPGAPAQWLVPAGGGGGCAPGTLMRLTVYIDRSDMSRTRAPAFALTEQASADAPAHAWMPIPPE